MLTDVVRGGTGTEAAIPSYTVAGKTGTAQKSDGHPGYWKRARSRDSEAEDQTEGVVDGA